MLTKDSYLIQQTLERALMTQHLLEAVAARCWQSGDDTPTETVSLEVIETLAQMIHDSETSLKEIQSANHEANWVKDKLKHLTTV